MRAPRDLNEWMRSVERSMSEAKRALNTVPLSYYEKVSSDNLADRTRTPAAPVEITSQTALYTDGVLSKRFARLVVDFPDVTKATDGSDIPIAGYELWGRDDSSNYLDAGTGAAPGVAAPGLTFPGLARTDAMEEAAAGSIKPWKLLTTSAGSALRVDQLVPGSVWTFKVRALGVYTIAPGVFSQEYQVQLTADTTPPPQPTAPVLSVARGTITVNWDGMSVSGSMPADFHHLEVAWGTTSSPTAEKDRFFRGNGVTVISDAEYYKPVFVRFRAVDESGNVSAWSEQATAFTTPLVDTDIILAEIDANVTMIRNLGAEALKDGAVLASKLADNAVTQEKLADHIISLGKLENTVTDSIQQGISDAAAAAQDAADADAKAGLAQDAADAAKALVADVVASGLNMLQNGNFDLPILSPPTGWPNRTLAYVEANAGSRSGANVMRLAPTTGIAYAYSDYFASAKDRWYVAEMWVKLASAPLDNTGDTIGFYFSALSDTGASAVSPVLNSEGLRAVSLSETTWTRVSFQYKVTQTGNIKLRVGPRFQGNGNVYLVDDFKVVDVTDRVDALAAAAAAQLKADQAFDDAQEALEAAGLAQGSANGKNAVYYTTSAPSGSGFKINDIWFRSSDNKIHLWDGDSWEPRVDTAIATAQSAANAAAAAASAADAKAVIAQDAADAAQQAADDASAEALVADDKADAAQVAAANAATAASNADTKAVNAQTAANNAASAASAAQTSANNAASAASIADGKAVAAQDAADDAADAAAAAQDAGDAAALLANSIVKTSTSDATGTPPSAGALWNKTNADGSLIIKTWTANADGTAWVVRKLDDAVIGNLNAATINAGIIAAARFNAADIRAKFLEAGKVTAADIVTGTLTSASGVFGTMDASVINSGTINSARLNAADIRAKFIEAGKITAADIVTGALTSASGIFGTVDASVLNTGTLNAARIAAGSIAANKLIIGSAANAVPDPSFSLTELTDARIARSTGGAAAWTVGAPAAGADRYVSRTTSSTADSFTYFTATPPANSAANAMVKMVAGQKWLFSVDVETSASAGVRWNVYRHRSDGSVVFEALSPYSTASGRRNLSFVYTVPVGTVALDLALLCNTSGVVFTVYGNAVAALQASATLIEDSGITTPKIATDAVRANHVKTGELVAGHLVAGTLTSASGVFGDVNASTISSGTINAARLNAGDIRAKFLAAGLITAADMVTNTITAASGIIGSLDISKVTTGQLDGIYIKSRTIAAEHLMISDLSDFAPSYAESPGDWTADTGLSNNVTSVAAAQDKRRWSASGVTDGVAKLARGPYKKVAKDEELYASGQIYRTGPTTNDIALRWYFYDANKVYVSGAALKLDGSGEQVKNLANAAIFECKAIVPDGVMYARLTLVITNSTGDDIGMYNITGRRRMGGRLIVDGSVDAQKVNAASVAGAVGSFIELNVSQLNATTASMDQAVIDKLWADVVTSRRLSTDYLHVGRGVNGLVDEFFEAADVKAARDSLSGGWGAYGRNTTVGLNWYGGALTAGTSRSFYYNSSTTAYDKGAFVPVEPGQKWRFAFQYTSATSGPRMAIRVILRDGTASYVTTGITKMDGTSNAYEPAGSVATVERMYTVPSDVTHVMPSVQFNSACTTAYVYGGATFTNMMVPALVSQGAILTSHLGSESVTAAKIKALDITSGQLAANSVITDKLATGSITASKLESTLVLATKILAGPANDTHAEMAPEGFKVFAKDALGNVNETVRLGVAASNDYFAVTNAAQELVTTIAEDGTVSARKMVTDQFTYKGEDLQVVLDKASLGMVAWGQFNGNQLPATIANGTERGLFEIAWEPVGTRMYAVSCSPVLFTPNAQVATAACFRMRYTTDGSQPTTTSPILAEDFKPILVNGSWTMSFQFADRLIGGFNGSYIRILFSIAASNGNGLITELGQSPTFVVKDLGPAYPKAGVLSNQVGGGGGGSRPPVVTRRKYYTAVDRRSYKSDNTHYNWDGGRMYQGPSPAGVGHLRSMAFFNDMTADLSGATINDMQVYLYFDHWYNNSGGTAKIGLHGHTGAVPSTFNWVGWIMDSEGWPKPGGRWLRIPEAYWDGFKSGAYRGITLGVNTTGNVHYGIAAGSPQIYVQYTV